MRIYGMAEYPTPSYTTTCASTRLRIRVVMGMRVFAAGRTVTHAEPREGKGSWGA